MKKIAIAFLMSLLMGGFTAFAGNDDKKSETTVTHSLSGKIIDQTNGESLAGVKVQIDGTDQVVYSDLDGNFSFPQVSQSNCSLRIAYISYQTQVLTNLQVGKDAQPVKCELKPLEQ